MLICIRKVCGSSRGWGTGYPEDFPGVPQSLPVLLTFKWAQLNSLQNLFIHEHTT
jgi:hypothetical protein